MVTVYGIGNCDSVRKARRWLDAHGVDHVFHDLRKDGLDGALLDAWLGDPGWEALVNRRSTTWRSLPEATRSTLGAETARALLLSHPTLVRRPLVDTGSTRHVGFSEAAYARLFADRQP